MEEKNKDRSKNKDRNKNKDMSMDMDMAYAYWLYSIPGVGNKGIDRLLEQGGSPEHLYHNFAKISQGIIRESVRERALEFTRGWKLREEWNRLADRGRGFTFRGREEYPRRLVGIPDAPYGLFFQGCLPRESVLTVAVVGARECSAYGRYLAEAVGAYLGSRGIGLVSGMARGVDGIAQRAALEAGGYSVGVLGCGVDICYPRESEDLYGMLEERGCLMSLVPPGTLPRPSLFPPRNRVVSGLADAVLVIEARERSGTLITVDMALDQGREVFAVPGRVTDRLSDGCNRLLRQGAGIFLSPESFERDLEDLFPGKKRWQPKKEENKVENGKVGNGEVDSGSMENSCGGHLDKEEKLVLSCLDICPLSVQTLMERTGEVYTYGQLHNILMGLCIKGRVKQVSQAYFILMEQPDGEMSRESLSKEKANSTQTKYK